MRICNCITETEAKERNDFKASIRTLVLNGDFQKVETSAEEFRVNKSRFRNGYWKLRAFYLAFGNLPGNVGWLEWIDKLRQWETQYHDSITPKIALAQAYSGYACAGRGSDDWGYKVTDEAAKLMEEIFSQSFIYLSEAKKLLQKKMTMDSIP